MMCCDRCGSEGLEFFWFGIYCYMCHEFVEPIEREIAA